MYLNDLVISLIVDVLYKFISNFLVLFFYKVLCLIFNNLDRYRVLVNAISKIEYVTVL